MRPAWQEDAAPGNRFQLQHADHAADEAVEVAEAVRQPGPAVEAVELLDLRQLAGVVGRPLAQPRLGLGQLGGDTGEPVLRLALGAEISPDITDQLARAGIRCDFEAAENDAARPLTGCITIPYINQLID